MPKLKYSTAEKKYVVENHPMNIYYDDNKQQWICDQKVIYGLPHPSKMEVVLETNVDENQPMLQESNPA